jgi:hypothetical protein
MGLLKECGIILLPYYDIPCTDVKHFETGNSHGNKLSLTGDVVHRHRNIKKFLPRIYLFDVDIRPEVANGKTLHKPSVQLFPGNRCLK